MAGGQERTLRRRIRSIQSTKKITRAMELIAASRIVKAQQAIAAARPYVEKMAEVVSHLADTPDGREHPLFREPDSVGKAVVIAIAGDRGLSGAYNSSVIRATERVLAERSEAGAEVSVVASGRKVINYFRYRDRQLAASFTGFSERPTSADAKEIADAVMEPFTAGDVDEITLVYTNFISVGTQRVVVRKLIPLDPEAANEGSDGDGRSDDGDGGRGDGDRDSSARGSSAGGDSAKSKADYEFEPDPGEILDRLLPSWLQAEILAALLSASASEYAARQRAMKAATDNADDLIKTLSRIMNRARQDAITTEIMEIVGGAEALRGGEDHGSATESYESAEARPA
ncbi:MAG: F0F1 ATP synthase subunit gamma [Actinomycetota bacterium]|nr:F0F1 ATP synthase subunit gamma [Actinomycetota bacterium]